MSIVGYVVDKNGRHPAPKMVRKIVEWPPCATPKDVRMFLGLCVYYQIWVEGFARIAAPLFDLLRKDIVFQWTIKADAAMGELKKRLTAPPALVSIMYSKPLRPIIISVDGSKKGWGAVLQQEDSEQRRRPVRYESGVWSIAEQNWDSGKHECKAMLLALKKFRPWIYGVHFVVETDARTLVDQLNRSASDLPGALITRWLALLNMWEFEVRHIPGKKNVVADALSRRPEPEGWSPPTEPEDDVEDFIDHHLGTVTLLFDELPHYLRDVTYACSTTVLGEESVLDHLKTEQFRNIAKWLLTLKNPGNMDRKALCQLRNKARRYCIKRGFLWEKTTGDRPLRRVIDDGEEQQRIIEALHDECGHKGKENTWRQVWNRYSWPKMYEAIQHYVKMCYQCQIHSSKRWEEELYPAWGPEVPWGWITVVVVYMPNGRNGKKYLVVARDLLTGYVEAKALSTNDSATVVKFLEEFVFSRWGVPYLMLVDGGPENRGLVKDLAVQFGIHRVVSSAYNSKAQGFIERGHQPIVGALKKMTGNWVDNLHLALWADRITVKRSTGESPVYLISGKEHVLPIELSIPTWQPWNGILCARLRNWSR
jgi:ribonuclease HI